MAPPRKENCDCGVLDRASKEPDHAIRFDPELNEYNIVYGKTGKMVIHYCPHCGGRVPESLRASLFAHVTETELQRIVSLLKDIKTVADVIARFGPPDEEREGSARIRYPEKDGKSASGELFLRTLIYRNVSDTLELNFSVGANESVHPSWHGKYIGSQKEPSKISD